ncbi:substrate-binding domain-containing protein [Clostridium sp. C8-1-8]|uniref:substrate-binding domain-containing protein n=1 Tax=Clostridium sp. C8-1-8 TaxID=2698831 RepID=UPI00136C008F|nr:substrate-binding domain-containing protein [Clostridium sp. C8-1-8]
MKRSLLSLVLCITLISTFTFIVHKNQTKKEKQTKDFYMITFLSGIEYWKGAYQGFSEKGKSLGVNTHYTGSIQYDINQEVTILEQVLSKKPAGIAISCANPNAFSNSINKAISMGIPIVTFDADSPSSNRFSYLATGNEKAGAIAAETLANLMEPTGGEIAIMTLPEQENHEQRLQGFINKIKRNYNNIKIVQIGNCKGDSIESAKLVASFLQIHPNIRGIFCSDANSGVGAATAVTEAKLQGKVKIVGFDTDQGTLGAIKTGVINATISQNTYKMGSTAMDFLYNLSDPNFIKAKDKVYDIPYFVDTGVTVITDKNVDKYLNN